MMNLARPNHPTMATAISQSEFLSAGDCAHDHERLGAGRNLIWQQRIRRLVRNILAASKEAYERSALMRHLITYRAAEHWVLGFEGIKDRTLGDLAREGECYLAVDMCKLA